MFDILNNPIIKAFITPEKIKSMVAGAAPDIENRLINYIKDQEKDGGRFVFNIFLDENGRLIVKEMIITNTGHELKNWYTIDQLLDKLLNQL